MATVCSINIQFEMCKQISKSELFTKNNKYRDLNNNIQMYVNSTFQSIENQKEKK